MIKLEEGDLERCDAAMRAEKAVEDYLMATDPYDQSWEQLFGKDRSWYIKLRDRILLTFGHARLYGFGKPPK